MKSINFFLLACLCFGYPAYAQPNPGEPDMPILKSVSVNWVTGHVTIEWTVENPPVSPVATHEFEIFWFEPQPTSTNPNAGTNHSIARIPNPATRSYTFDYAAMPPMNPEMPDPRETAVAFTITAVHQNTSTNEDTHSLHSNKEYCIHVNSDYYKCNDGITLNWTPYEGWLGNTPPYEELEKYRVMLSKDGSPYGEIASYTDRYRTSHSYDVNENGVYTFYIEAVRSDGVTSTSYRTTKEIKIPVQPTYIHALGTGYNSDGLAEITFEIDPNAETNTYEFRVSSSPDFSRISLSEPVILDDFTKPIVLTDERTREATYCYKLEARNVCMSTTIVESNTATALWITLKQDDQVNQLRWDPYLDWGGNVRYELHRQIGDEPEEMINSSGINYDDNLWGIEISGDVCYWITAKPESPTSPEQIAVSNTVCIKPESDIFIPAAFIPKDVGLNAEWKPFFSYPPQEYMLVLYDRMGAKVFETKDVNAGWNGQLMNGKPAGEGVYVYYLKFLTAKDKWVEKGGTFSLID